MLAFLSQNIALFTWVTVFFLCLFFPWRQTSTLHPRTMCGTPPSHFTRNFSPGAGKASDKKCFFQSKNSKRKTFFLHVNLLQAFEYIIHTESKSLVSYLNIRKNIIVENDKDFQWKQPHITLKQLCYNQYCLNNGQNSFWLII